MVVCDMPSYTIVCTLVIYDRAPWDPLRYIVDETEMNRVVTAVKYIVTRAVKPNKRVVKDRTTRFQAVFKVVELLFSRQIRTRK